MSQFTNTNETRENFVRLVNSGEVRTVKGREVWNRFNMQTCTSWGNGSVSVDVRGRDGRSQGTVWVKNGQTVDFS